MKYITAVVRRTLVADVLGAARHDGFPVLSVSEVSVVAELHDPAHEHISFAYEGRYSTLCKLEFMCADDEEQRLVRILTRYGRTDQPGDGYVLVWSLDRSIRIRTGKEGLEAFRSVQRT